MSEIKLLADIYREQQLSTNLYTPENIYQIDGETANRVISIIGENVLGQSMDFSNTILGRILLPNTPIQQIANRELGKELFQRISKQLRQNVIGSLNVSLEDGISYNTPNYWSVTNIQQEDDNTISKILDTLLGYQSTDSPFENYYGKGNEFSLDNRMKDLTGEGTLKEYNKNIENNKYSISDRTYVNDTNLSLLNNHDIVDDENSLEIKTENFLNNNILLDNGYPSNNGDFSELNTAAYSNSPNAKAFYTLYEDQDGFWVYNQNSKGGLVSKGNNTKSSNSNTYCRTWTMEDGYKTFSNAMKFANSKNLTGRLNTVQQSNIIPNIFPTLKDINNKGYVKNLMFSIENLAYDLPHLRDGLKKSEKGRYGRVMWFPPYITNITESVLPKFNSNNFLGRNEPLYTYNGVERTLNISFQLVVDTPSILNKNFNITNNSDEYARLFGGCYIDTTDSMGGVSDKTKKDAEIAIANTLGQDIDLPPLDVDNPFDKGNSIKFYFSNDSYNLAADMSGPTDDDEIETGKTANLAFSGKIDQLIEFLLNDGKDLFKVTVKGNASKLYISGAESGRLYNTVLSYLRAYNGYSFLFDRISSLAKTKDYQTKLPIKQVNGHDIVPSDKVAVNTQSDTRFTLIPQGSNTAINNNSTPGTIDEDVVDRYIEIYLEKSSINYVAKENQDKVVKENQDKVVNNLTTIANSNDNGNITSDEFYFEQLKENDPFIFNAYKDRIKYFNPVFHAQTPEDFNTRLTFLHQCTRQGMSEGNDVTNSIFGKPPVSILRIGDFFHSKVIINSVTFNYEPLVWDMNPEGIGVQPMLCNVTMDMYVIGGQSLEAPLNKLLNALDNNFYANTELFEVKAADTAKTINNIENTTLEDAGYTQSDAKTQADYDVDQMNRRTQNVTTMNKPIPKGTVGSGSNKTISYISKMNLRLSIIDNWYKALNNGGTAIQERIINGLLPLVQYADKVSLGDLNFNVYTNTYKGLKNLESQYNRSNLSDVFNNNKDGDRALVDNDNLDTVKDVYNDLLNFFTEFIINFEPNTKAHYDSEYKIIKSNIDKMPDVFYL